MTVQPSALRSDSASRAWHAPRRVCPGGDRAEEARPTWLRAAQRRGLATNSLGSDPAFETTELGVELVVSSKCRRNSTLRGPSAEGAARAERGHASNHVQACKPAVAQRRGPSNCDPVAHVLLLPVYPLLIRVTGRRYMRERIGPEPKRKNLANPAPDISPCR